MDTNSVKYSEKDNFENVHYSSGKLLSHAVVILFIINRVLGLNLELFRVLVLRNFMQKFEFVFFSA